MTVFFRPMNNLWPLRRAIFAGLLALTCCSGCAVLTVDVDVYKGVLSNEPATQREHLRALIPVGKTLLIQMFNELEINRGRRRLVITVKSNKESLQPQYSDSSGWKSAGGSLLDLEWNQDVSNSVTKPRVENLSELKISQRIIYVLSLFWPSDSPIANLTTIKSEGKKENRGVPEGGLNSFLNLNVDELNPARDGGKVGTQDSELLVQSMSFVANQIVLINQMGDVGRKGIFPRMWEAMKDSGRYAGIPKASDAAQLIEALGHSILAITDELTYRKSWETESRRRALQDLVAIRENLLVQPGLSQNIIAAYADELVFNAVSKLEACKAAISAAEAKKRKDALAELNREKDAAELALSHARDFKEEADAALEAQGTDFSFWITLDALAKREDKKRNSFAPEVKGLRDYYPIFRGEKLELKDVTQAQVSHYLTATLRAVRLRLQLVNPGALSEEHRAMMSCVDTALAQIEGQAAESIPLRPAGAILRTVTPITSMQGNAPAESGNMLTQHLIGSVPFIGGALEGFLKQVADPSRNPGLLARLDREFWQPINHIEVQGTGKTNYAVIKDDVGNWYVKSFAADPEVAFKSFSKFLQIYSGAKGLALIPGATAGKSDALPAVETSTKIKEAVAAKEEELRLKFAVDVERLKKSLETLAEGAVEGVTKPSKQYLDGKLTTIAGLNQDKRKDQALAYLFLGRDYSIERLSRAELSHQEATKAEAVAAQTISILEDRIAAATAASKTDAVSSLGKEKEKASDVLAKNKVALASAATERALAVVQHQKFKTIAEVFISAYNKALRDHEKFLQDSLLGTI